MALLAGWGKVLVESNAKFVVLLPLLILETGCTRNVAIVVLKYVFLFCSFVWLPIDVNRVCSPSLQMGQEL